MEQFEKFIHQPSNLFYLILVITLIITRIPYIGKYFRVVDTIIHETAHALMAVFTSGKVLSINLFADTSGSTVTKSTNKFGQVLVSLAGYPISSLTALFMIYLIKTGNHLLIIFILVSIAIIGMMLFIRNGYGLVWAGTFSVLNFLIIYFNHQLLIQSISIFYALIILSDSVIAPLYLLVLSVTQSAKAGDATNLKKATHIPAVLWALLFSAIAIYCGYWAVKIGFPQFNYF
jgi:Peptidase M50B-like